MGRATMSAHGAKQVGHFAIGAAAGGDPKPLDAARRRRRAGRELLHHDHAIIDGPCHARLVTLAHREAGLPKRTPNGAAAGKGPVGHRERSSRARHLDFLRSTQRCIRAPRIPGFWPVAFPWNSLDSLVRNEPFQWVTSDLGPILFFARPFPENMRRKGPAVVDPKVDRDETPRRAERAGRAPGSWQSTSRGPIGALGSD